MRRSADGSGGHRTGGEGPGLFAGLPEAERPLEVIWLVFEPETGELFGRYRVAG